MILTALIFLILLSVLVLIHEAGHYFVAKKFGIKVEEFGFGIPPRAWGKKIGETIWSINWLPLGGFVKLYGEDEAGGGKPSLPAKGKGHAVKGDLDRAFFSKPVWQRATVVVAGVVMNALLAFFIYYIFLFFSNYKTELPLIGDHTFFFVNQENKSEILISEVVENSPAAKAGMKAPAKILSINGKRVAVNEFSNIIKENKGKEISLEWEDLLTNQKRMVTLVPRVNPPKGEGSLGIGFGPLDIAVLRYETPAQRVLSGVVHPINLMVYNLDIMGELIKVSIEKKTAAPVSEGVSGPVGIYSLVGDILKLPLKEAAMQLLNLAGILSISLAFFNVLPIPALDGGRLFFILVEGLTGKKISPQLEGTIHSVGMAILLGLIILITFKDIANLF